MGPIRAKRRWFKRSLARAGEVESLPTGRQASPAANKNMNPENKEIKSEIKIIPASPEDAKGVAEVFYKTWLATYPNEEVGITVDDVEDRFKDAFTEENLAKRADKIANPEEGASFLVAKDGDKVIGLCRIAASENHNQLQAIYVLPEYQGQGVGNMLWEEAKKSFSSESKTIVHVARYNKNAIAFYKKLGFQETGKEFIDEKFKLKSGAMIPETELIIEAIEKPN